MCAKQLLRLLRDPRKIMPEDVQALQDLLSRYPYFQLAYALLAKAACNQEAPGAAQAVQTAAVYATDRHRFKALLEGTLPLATPEPATMPPAPASKAKANAPEKSPGFVNDYINAIQKKTQKKITKSQSLAQLDSIQDFLQKNVKLKIQPPSAAANEDFQVDLTQKSTSFHDEMATETLAQILWQQGKLQRALGIYEKLMLRFPEKRTYFGNLIEKIKHEI